MKLALEIIGAVLIVLMLTLGLAAAAKLDRPIREESAKDANRWER